MLTQPLDWPNDVAQLADALGLDQFAVGGVSGAGPYAPACSYKLGRRMTSATLINGVGPFDVPELAAMGLTRPKRQQFLLAGRVPWVVRALMAWQARNVPNNPERIAAKLVEEYPACDMAVVRRPGSLDLFLQDTREVFR